LEGAEIVDQRLQVGYLLSAELVQIVAETKVNPEAQTLDVPHLVR
jgi:hypothetical protein